MYHGHHPILESDYCPNLVITGHTHIPEIIQEGEVLRLNPGSAGPRRFRQPVTLARLKIIERRVEAQIIHLPVG
jgi:predicted phosphodiesterase